MKRFIPLMLIAASSLFAKMPADLPPRGPILTTSAIIEIYNDETFAMDGIVLIQRGKEPFGYALPGGKVEYGEQVEDAVRREMFEEVNLDIEDLRQFHVYSHPARDPRFHSVEVTFIARSNGSPHAGDDAAHAWVCPLTEIPWTELAFDHAQILKDYLAKHPAAIGSLNLFGRPKPNK